MEYHIAQLNIGRMLAALDHPIMADFVSNLTRINTLGENSEGFVWRLKDETDNATSINLFNDDFIIVNLTVWENSEALFRFAYHSDHVEIVKRRKEWFEKMDEMHMGLWYIPAGVQTTPAEAKERLIYLRTYGETPYAFTFRKRFTIEEAKNYLPLSSAVL